MKIRRNSLQIVDKEVVTCLRGIAAVGIMLGHITAGSSWPISTYFPGGLWVGLFFFFSGYGLHYSLQNCNHYLESFVVKKIAKIYIPFLIAEFCYSFISGEMGGVLYKFIGLNLSNTVLWYVTELLFICFIFYTLIKILGRDRYLKICIPVLTLIYVIFLIVSVYFDIGVWWYYSTPLFLIGCLFNKYDGYIKTIFNKSLTLIAFICAFVLFYSAFLFIIQQPETLFLIKRNYIIVFFYMILTPSFFLFISSVVQLIDLNNFLLRNLGNVSYEIYLWHKFVFLLLTRVFVETLIVVLITTILTITFSFVVKFLNHQICHVLIRNHVKA